MKQALTERQGEILKFVELFRAKYGYSPTRHEIAEGFGFASCNAAEQHLRALETKGWVRITPRISRGLVLL